MRKPLREHQDIIMDEFDFAKVKRVMDHLDWQWVGTEEGVPTIGEMRRLVRDLMARSYDYATKSGKDSLDGTGGFVVEYFVIDDSFRVHFHLAEWET